MNKENKNDKTKTWSLFKEKHFLFMYSKITFSIKNMKNLPVNTTTRIFFRQSHTIQGTVSNANSKIKKSSA